MTTFFHWSTRWLVAGMLVALSVVCLPPSLGKLTLAGVPALAQPPILNPELLCLGMRFSIEGSVLLRTEAGFQPGRGVRIVLTHGNVRVARPAFVTDDGRYGFDNLCPGEYVVEVVTGELGYVQPAGGDFYRPVEVVDVEVVAANVTRVDFDLRQVRREMRVAVNNTTPEPRQPIAGVRVVLLFGDNTVRQLGRTSADGEFVFSRLECCSTPHTIQLDAGEGPARAYLFDVVSVTTLARLEQPTTVYFTGVEREQVLAPATPGAGGPTTVTSTTSADPILPRPPGPPGLFGTVPDVLGDLVTPAIAEVQRAGFVPLGVRGPITDDRSQWGHVDSTRPPGGATLRVGEPVRLDILRRDPDKRLVPNVFRSAVAAALGELALQGLEADVRFERACLDNLTPQTLPNCRDRIGTVMRQSPDADELVDVGSTVRIVVGEWPDDRAVPRVAFGWDVPGSGLYREDALPILCNAGFQTRCNAGFQTRISNTYQREGCQGDGVILRQHPDPDLPRPFGTVVELVLCYDDGFRSGENAWYFAAEFWRRCGGGEACDEEWRRAQRIGQDLVCLPDGPTP